MHAFIIHVNIFYIYIHNVCALHIYCVYTNTHTCMFVFKKNVVHILNACIYNTCKYVLCMCVYIMCIYELYFGCDLIVARHSL